ncbi:rRNA maturation RNase YbeY [Pedobacter deserti]|uniref:rRNA maturation RNase YbeY n=1 Tax=Pedobacter deserti TaxID=2817382 RepID=UPI00210D3CDF|nr:rRNA maturation RNase YbeY [Pedobacter sp. SYSU D00382]
MPKPAIFFFSEDLNFTLKNKTVIRSWLLDVIQAEGYMLSELNFIFCSDAYLLDINKRFLQHDTFTDVVTFDSSEEPKTIQGDIFISVDRIRENASTYKEPFLKELCRVMVHGTLHLLGYKDKSKTDKARMTDREDHYLAILTLLR